MRAGRLRHQVEIQIHQENLGTRGQNKGGWTTIAKARCEIQTLQGNKLIQARQNYATATDQVKLRFGIVKLTTKHRLLFKGRELYIGFIDNVEQRDRELVLLVGETAPS